MADLILGNLAESANRWWPLALLWHGYFLGLALSAGLGRPIGGRGWRVLLTLPLVSVSAVSWAGGDYFNGIVMLAAFAALLVVDARAPGPAPLRPSPLVWTIGLSLVALGWTYPHFLNMPSAAYLYAAPLGVLPCPTLAMMVGFCLMALPATSRAFLGALAALGAFYGLFGGLYLNVTLDVWLAGGALLLGWRFLREPAGQLSRAPR